MYNFEHTWESICDKAEIAKRINYIDQEFYGFIKDKKLPK